MPRKAKEIKGGRMKPPEPVIPVVEIKRLSSAPKRMDEMASGTVLKGSGGGLYRIKEKLDEGGMGSIYKAVQVQGSESGKLVAIKFVSDTIAADQALLERFRLETEALKRISHRNVVRIIDSGETYFPVSGIKKPYIVMEFVEGEDLDGILGRKRHLAWEEAKPVLLGICDGLIAAHKQGIIHRDMKPANVRIESATGNPKIIDFGIAKNLNEASSLTATGTALGTPDYMSPEQSSGAKGIDERSDVYSFCAMAYHLLTGETLFSGGAFEIAMKHINEEPLAPRVRKPGLGIPKEVEEVIMKGLRKDKTERYASATDLKEALGRCGDEHQPSLFAPETDKRGFMYAPEKRHGRLIAITLLIAAAALAAVTSAVIAAGRLPYLHPRKSGEIEKQEKKVELAADSSYRRARNPDAAAADGAAFTLDSGERKEKE